MYFDTHAHYDDEQFDADRDSLLDDIFAAGVELIVNAGTDLETSRFSLSLAEKYPFVYCAVGYHPEEADKLTDEGMAEIEKMLAHPRVRAIGEIGLDYHYAEPPREIQHACLRRQLELARKTGKPVIIHDRDAHEDCMEAVFRHGGLRGVFHCFSGSAEMAKELLRRGWYLGFDGPITYKNNKKAAEVVAVTPPERMLIETDSPYLSPVPYRGQRNDSTHLPAVLEKLAGLTGLSADALEAQTWENAVRLFGI